MYNRGILAENGAALAMRAYKERKRKEYQEEMRIQRQEENKYMEEFTKSMTNMINDINDSVKEFSKLANNCTVTTTETRTEGRTKYGYMTSHSITTTTSYNIIDNRNDNQNVYIQNNNYVVDNNDSFKENIDSSFDNLNIDDEDFYDKFAEMFNNLD